MLVSKHQQKSLKTDRLLQLNRQHLTISTIFSDQQDTEAVHLFSVSSLVSPLETGVLVEAPKQM